jgi:hypothetical protein
MTQIAIVIVQIQKAEGRLFIVVHNRLTWSVRRKLVAYIVDWYGTESRWPKCTKQYFYTTPKTKS